MKEKKESALISCHFLVLTGFYFIFFSTNTVKPVDAQCVLSIQQPQKAEVEMSQEQEKTTKKTSLAARMGERNLHEQVENTTSHHLFDVEWERFLGKVTAQGCWG